MSALRLTISTTLLLLLSIATFERNYVWNDRIVFWSDVALKSPHRTRSHNNLGSALIAAGRCGDAMPSLMQSVKIDQWYIEPHYNLAICYVKKNRFDAAIPELEKVISINVVLKKGHYGVSTAPRFEMQAHSTLGNIYNMKGMFDKAVFHFQEALKLSPKDAVTRFNLALTYETMGMLKEAKAELEEVLKINPMDEGAKRGIKRLGAAADMGKQ
ncbi:MAG: hypothetical protein A3G39_09750 [Deltaproteobacteria bacterium RIFCSPLOWO2_12_FULL_43_16]|nr:MAG: hypothetical protein A2Z89_06160 [Deltaproteobacteria bacterium GWA2_43_19]OGQ10989.1 MAG: hypothetical protein A3D30_01860 [Deltaproteobacteria bacterium RIFCSPHIGHO2_02_FULL_43_33]OGQ44124.1 MAG: hypothetical protein A3A85_05940 [Deltaproteobacteria bacterium RIFCSPLOWO2_01_FULL_42_9]OGQ60129.1 MAG: hypothetical protein A3G39_09750 [Deltaproteobacteria bacterium RIFCSPLOWO2_12_FULL_43_16]HBR16187.1 hypothetical protein [Deltaproteobacteria bacterium]